VTREAGETRRRRWALIALAAVCLWSLVGVSTARAHDVNANLPGSCQVDNNAGRATMTVTITNSSTESVLNVTPSDPFGSGSGNANFFIQTGPRPLATLLAGKSAQFVWRGRFYGDGFVDLSVRVTASFSDNTTETTGVVNCNRVVVGNPNTGQPATPTPPAAESTATRPAATSTATQVAQRPTRTPRLVPTNTPNIPPPATNTPALRATRTPIQARPTRTPMQNAPTQAPRPTRTQNDMTSVRTPISLRATRTPMQDPPPQQQRPTRTPVGSSDPQRPTRTPIQARPTRTPNIIVDPPTPRLAATRTPTGSSAAPTRTPIGARPTRTPIGARPTRTPNNLPPTATPTRMGVDPTPNAAGFTASCSLRRTGDVVSVTMLVQNRTGVPLTAVHAGSLLLEPEGGSLFFDRTGPSPASVPQLGNGMSVVIQWGGRLSAGGTMGFSAFAGATSSTGPVSTQAIDCGATAGADPPAFDASAFTASCSIDPSANGGATVTVRNASNETLTNVVTNFVGKSGVGTVGALNIRGPVPHNVATMATGAQSTFTFEANFEGSGQMTMQFQATAVRSNSAGVSTGTISCSADVGVSGGNLPDLTVDQNDLQNSIELQTQTFTASSCAVVEGCVDGLGQRTLLRFDSATPNLGPGDVFLGNPVGNPEFIWSECHMHYHFTQYADYRLLDMSGNIVARGHKQAFCLVDLWHPPGLGGVSHPQFTNCGFQGISAGWADVYDRELDCQWIDVTGVPSGRYVLEVQINPAHVLPESNYDNNTGRAEVTIP
jgi:hypothetical protein